METPLPNDSSKASLSPPVGGRLHSFSRDWQTNNCSSNVLNIITNGYVLPFLSKPNLVRFPLILSEYKALQKDQALADCIQFLLSKNAIEKVENVKSLGFYSRRLQRTQISPIPGRLANQVPVSGGSPSQHSGSGRPNVVLGLDNKPGKSELKPTQVFSLMGYEYHLDSALVNPLKRDGTNLRI